MNRVRRKPLRAYGLGELVVFLVVALLVIGPAATIANHPITFLVVFVVAYFIGRASK